jgi:outer membrane protein OmpA-like peptidoglycan-associated protein
MLASAVSGKLSSRYGIAVTSVAPDNNTLFLIGKLKADTPPTERVMVAYRTKEGWSIPKPIKFQSIKQASDVVDYAFGTDQRTLILSMESDSAIGGRDLYVCMLDDSTDSWTPPLWLGRGINSAYDEITPYLAANGKTLYFSSSRPGCTGEIDVWRSERLDDTWKKWSPPEHLDNLVNRHGRTTYYTEDAEGKYAYFVWRPNTTAQPAIYRTKAPPSIVAVTLIKGSVTDETGAPLESEIRYERLSDGKTLGLAHCDPKTGSYQITLPAGESYAIYATKKGYLSTSERFDAREVKAFSAIERNLTLVKIKENAVIRLNNIFFETDRATLLPESFAELNRLTDIMKRDEGLHISIEGHTDATGSADHNKKLSAARAQAVVEYLKQKGIAEGRLESVGYGSERPVSTNETEEGKALNRRVEFRILK